jgi:hypothetical protein
MTVNIWYMGFQSKAIVREYRFLLRESSIAPHEIKFTIVNEAFRSHGLRDQDAPDLCSLKRHREMANSVDDPGSEAISGKDMDTCHARPGCSQRLPSVSE